MVINYERASYAIARRVAATAAKGGPDAPAAQAWLDKRRFVGVRTSAGVVVLRAPVPREPTARLFGLSLYVNPEKHPG